jgi:hypothetical protein
MTCWKLFFRHVRYHSHSLLHVLWRHFTSLGGYSSLTRIYWVTAKIAGAIFPPSLVHADTQKRTFHRGNYRHFKGLGARYWVEKDGSCYFSDQYVYCYSPHDMKFSKNDHKLLIFSSCWLKVKVAMGIFSNCQIVLEFGTSIRFKEKKALRTDVTDNGGVISYIITKKVT